MNCKFCQGELPEDTLLCPHCGGDNAPQEEKCAEECNAVPTDPVCQEVPEEVAPEAEPQQENLAESEQPVEEESVDLKAEVAASPKIRRMKRVAAISGCIAVLAVLATVLLFGVEGNWKFLDFLKPRENNAQYKDSYTVSDKKAQSKRDVVIATLGDAELTNGKLQVYYWMQVYDFLDYYGYYASYFGMDYTKPLDEQDFSGGGTWQQYFLESALENWRTYQALALEAEANGFQLDSEYQEKLDSMESDLTETAIEQGYSTADELIQAEMGAGCTAADYIEYMRVYYTGYLYFSEFYESLEYTDAELDDYFTANEETFKESSITKDSGNYVDVRHILIAIEELEENKDSESTDTQTEDENDAEEDDGNYGYTQEAWDACYAKAEEILNAWLAGEKTEESFAALATEKSEDTGSTSNGGLYTGVAKGDMVDAFDAWCFDEVRVVGDYGMVKTPYGWHIMYFSGSEEIWKAETRDAMISEATNEMVENAVEQYEFAAQYKKIVLAEVSLA